MVTTSPFRADALAGKIAIITGGGSGICYGITKELLLHGCSGAVICGRRIDFLQKSSAELSKLVNVNNGRVVTCLYKVCDVRNEDACKDVVSYTIQKFGKVDILINGAAGNFLAEAGTSLTPRGFQTVLDIDARGVYNMCYAVYPAMSKSSSGSGGGTIINISMTLHYGATWYQTHASAAKSAIDSITRSLALEWGRDNIRVNGIAPGPIANTPGTTKLAPGMTSDDVEDMIAERVPMGRLGTAFDIGMAAVYLSCDASGSYVSGTTLVVDGAEWLYKPPMVPREMVAELSRKVEAKSRALRPVTTNIKSKL
jgi:peroxisomal 2,4-dienoyl-CoA reductase